MRTRVLLRAIGLPGLRWPATAASQMPDECADETLTALEHRTRLGRMPYDFLRMAPEFKSLAANERFGGTVAVARAQFDDTIALLREADPDRSCRRSCGNR